MSLDYEPQFLFVLTPPYGGSTALAKTLNTAPRSMILQKRAEGQWLVPGMCEPDRWRADKTIDWDSVRAAWLKQFEMVNHHVETVRLVIEKSPPNLVRYAQLREHFPNSRFLGFNRDPYANCSSYLHHEFSTHRRAGEKRSFALRQLARDWLFRSGLIRQAIAELDVPHFTYEQFCANPADCLNAAISHCPDLAGADGTAQVVVKNYGRQGISNHNAKNIADLTDEDIAVISSVLCTDEPLLRFFGYKIL